MASVNKAIIVGNLGKDPEVRTFQNGGKVVNFSVATSESWRDKQSGEKREKTEWHNVSVTNEGIGGVAEKYLRKGSKVYVEGKIETRKWQDQSGQDRYSTQITVGPFGGALVLLDKQPEGDRDSAHQDDRASAQRSSRSEVLDDEIPF